MGQLMYYFYRLFYKNIRSITYKLMLKLAEYLNRPQVGAKHVNKTNYGRSILKLKVNYFSFK